VTGHVFISYSSKNQEIANGICAALEQRGLQCWISSRNIPPGANFQEAIVRAIRASAVMVLVFSRHANTSNEIKKELALASRSNLTVFPLRIEEVTPDEAFAYEFATRQWIDLSEDREPALDQLAAEISRITGTAVSAAPAAASTAPPREVPSRLPRAPVSRTGQRRWVAAGGAAAAVVAIMGFAGYRYLEALPMPAPASPAIGGATRPPPAQRDSSAPAHAEATPPQPIQPVALAPPPVATAGPAAATTAPPIAAPKPAFEARVLDVLDSRTLLVAGHGPVYLYGIKVKNLDESQAEADRTRHKMQEFFDVNGGSVTCYTVANSPPTGFRCFTKDHLDVAEWAIERGLAEKDSNAAASLGSNK
jgi:hypothetical protein